MYRITTGYEMSIFKYIFVSLSIVDFLHYSKNRSTQISLRLISLNNILDA